jgi:hypothetical protein
LTALPGNIAPERSFFYLQRAFLLFLRVEILILSA